MEIAVKQVSRFSRDLNPSASQVIDNFTDRGFAM